MFNACQSDAFIEDEINTFTNDEINTFTNDEINTSTENEINTFIEDEMNPNQRAVIKLRPLHYALQQVYKFIGTRLNRLREKQ